MSNTTNNTTIVINLNPLLRLLLKAGLVTAMIWVSLWLNAGVEVKVILDFILALFFFAI